MASILVIEDEARIASFVVKGLTAAGFSCTCLTLLRALQRTVPCWP